MRDLARRMNTLGRVAQLSHLDDALACGLQLYWSLIVGATSL